MGPQDPSARLLGQTGPERPVSHEKCPTAARLASPAFARPSPLYLEEPDVRTISSLHDVKCRLCRRRKSENRVQTPENAPDFLFWILASDFIVLVWTNRQGWLAKLKLREATARLRPSGYGVAAPAAPQRRLVEPDGIEPTTSCLQSRRSPN